MQKKPKILKIITIGNPILTTIADPVENPTSTEIKNTVNDMIFTAESDGGSVGLAAPQVNISLRILLFRENCEEPFTVAINPSLKFITKKTNIDWEACMSVPGYMGKVERFNKIKFTYYSLKGEKIIDYASNYRARVIQHEYDHLNGILFVKRLSDESALERI